MIKDLKTGFFDFALRIVRLCRELDEKPGVLRTLGNQPVAIFTATVKIVQARSQITAIFTIQSSTF